MSVPRSPTVIASSVKQLGDERVIDSPTTGREHIGPLDVRACGGAHTAGALGVAESPFFMARAFVGTTRGGGDFETTDGDVCGTATDSDAAARWISGVGVSLTASFAE